MHSVMKDKNNENKQYKCIAREIDLARISVFIIEKFESKLVNLFKVPGIEKLWHKPVNYYIDEKLKVTLFYKET